MKPITEEQIKEASSIHSDEYSKEDKKTASESFYEGAKWAIDQMQAGWIPISEYPADSIKPILRWHKVWRCLVSVQDRRAYAENGCRWISGTKDNTWPEEAFTPFYLNMVQDPYIL